MLKTQIHMFESNHQTTSKYKLNGIGKSAGITVFNNSIITNEPITLPNKRMHNETGRIAISMMLIGATKAIGSAKLFTNPSAFLWCRNSKW